MRTFKSVICFILIMFMLFDSPLKAYATTSSSVFSEKRSDTVEQLNSLNKLIDEEKMKFSSKNTAERIYVSYLDMLGNTVDFILEDAATTAYDRGYSGEQMGNLAKIQRSMEDLLSSDRQHIANYKTDDLLSKFLYIFSGRRIKESADIILAAIDNVDLTLFLCDLYFEGWNDGRENIELPKPLTYEEVVDNKKTIVDDITEYIMSDELAERLRSDVFSVYDGNKKIYVSKDGTRQHYSVLESGYADTDYIFYANRYNANGKILYKNYYCAVQCAGLALYTYDKLFYANYSNFDNLSKDLLVGLEKSDLNEKATLYDYFVSNGIDTGAHIRSKDINGKGGHSVIMLSYTQEGILIYEANHDSHYGVRYASMSWDTFVKYIFRNGSRKISYVCMPKNYEKIIHGTY